MIVSSDERRVMRIECMFPTSEEESQDEFHDFDYHCSEPDDEESRTVVGVEEIERNGYDESEHEKGVEKESEL